MAFSFGSKIITEGLVFYSDAANIISYGGSGAIWYDMSGNRNDVTLINSPTFVNTYGGGISFLSESSQRFAGSSVIPITTESFAVDIWYTPTTNAASTQWMGILSAGDIVGSAGLGNPITGWGIGMLVNIISGFDIVYGAVVTGSGIPATLYRFDGGFNMTPGTLYNIIMNRNTDLGRFELYVNGTLRSNLSVPNTYSVSSSIPIRTSIYGGGGVNFQQANGTYYNMKIYRGKYLTQANVTQNYNALKGRFGL